MAKNRRQASMKLPAGSKRVKRSQPKVKGRARPSAQYRYPSTTTPAAVVAVLVTAAR